MKRTKIQKNNESSSKTSNGSPLLQVNDLLAKFFNKLHLSILSGSKKIIPYIKNNPWEAVAVFMATVAIGTLFWIVLTLSHLMDVQMTAPDKADAFHYSATIQKDQDGEFVRAVDMVNSYIKDKKILYQYDVKEANVNTRLNDALLNEELTPLEVQLEVPENKNKRFVADITYQTVAISRDEAGNITEENVIESHAKTFEFAPRNATNE